MPNSAPPTAAPGQAAAGGDLAGVAGVEPAQAGQQLGAAHRGGEGEQPDRQPPAQQVAGELDDRRAQAEARALRHEAEHHPDEQGPGGQHPVLTPLLQQQAHGHLACLRV
jgi:hypothetical protein